MGTNYYWYPNPKPEPILPCATCHREFEQPEEECIHIGKSSGGWQFSFHGTDEIRSFADWRERFTRDGSRIEDEYDRVLPVSEFLAMVAVKRMAPNNHARQALAGEFGKVYGEEWLDADGNSFSGGEFS